MPPIAVLALAAALSTAPELAADAGDPVEVEFGEVSQWWKCTNFPALDPALGPETSQLKKPVAVKLAYTIGSDGHVGDCIVLKKTDPELDDGQLCELITLREHAPSKANPARRSIRTWTEIHMGPPGASRADITGDLRE